MTKVPLAQLLDPEELNRSTGKQATLKVTVPVAWLRDGGTVSVDPPKLLTCRRCQGGGCSQCGNSGAHRRMVNPGTEASLKVELAARDEPRGVTIRLVDPFEDSDIDQLYLHLKPGPAASIVRYAPKIVHLPATPTRRPVPEWIWAVAFLVVLLVLLVLMARR